MTKDERKSLILADIASGIDFDTIAERYKVDVSTVRYWSKKCTTEEVEQALVDLSKETLDALEVIKEKAVEVSPEISKNITVLMDKVSALKTLDEEFKEAMLKAVQWAQTYMEKTNDDGNSSLTLKEWQIITSTLSTAYGQIFNKAGTTINVAQSTSVGQNDQLSFFKQSQQV